MNRTHRMFRIGAGSMSRADNALAAFRPAV